MQALGSRCAWRHRVPVRDEAHAPGIAWRSPRTGTPAAVVPRQVAAPLNSLAQPPSRSRPFGDDQPEDSNKRLQKLLEELGLADDASALEPESSQQQQQTEGTDKDAGDRSSSPPRGSVRRIANPAGPQSPGFSDTQQEGVNDSLTREQLEGLWKLTGRGLASGSTDAAAPPAPARPAPEHTPAAAAAAAPAAPSAPAAPPAAPPQTSAPASPALGDAWQAWQAGLNAYASFAENKVKSQRAQGVRMQAHKTAVLTSLHAWRMSIHHPKPDELWRIMKLEAAQDAVAEPRTASTMHATVLSHNSFEECAAYLLANQLTAQGTYGMALKPMDLQRVMLDAFKSDPEIVDDMRADMLAVRDRDPACTKYLQVLINFKGYQSMCVHRVAHWLWNKGRKTLALALQSIVSQVFHVDIHPAARIGRGVMLDHATGVVIGETAVVGDNVVMLHRVTLGGSGHSTGLRHPVIGHGSLLGAGTSVLGPILVGPGCKVGAGSLVLEDIPSNCVAVGVPARVVKQDVDPSSVKSMDFMVDAYDLDFQI